ncbi:MAG: translocation/assembly module TamB [Bacteroidales bacterium]|nr:translocation/assembly module TamB [Bacteroidales bacterium]
MVILAFPISIYTALRDPFVQTFAVRTVAGYLSEQMGTKIRINSFFLDIDFSLNINGLQIEDKNKQSLLALESMNIQLLPTDFASELHIKRLILNNVEFNLIKYESLDDLNLQFIIDYFVVPEDTTSSTAPSSFKIRLDELELNNVAFQYWDKDRDDPDGEGIDYSHLALRELGLIAKNIIFEGDSVFAHLQKLTVRDSSGFYLKKFQAELSSSPRGSELKNLEIQTEKSTLNLDLKLLYQGYPAFLDFIDSVRMEANIKPSHLYMADIGYFADVMFDMTNHLDISGAVSGVVSDFKSEQFSFNYGDKTYFLGNFNMKGLPDFYTSDMVFQISKMQASARDLRQFQLPGKIAIEIPKELDVAGLVSVRGKFTGRYNDFLAVADINTDAGFIKTDLKVKTNPRTEVISYNGHLITKGLQLGKLLQQEEILGNLSLNTSLKGSGINLETADLSIDGKIIEIGLLGTTYKDIDLKGELSEKRFNGWIDIEDEKLSLDFNGEIDMNAKVPVFNFESEIKHADLAAMNLLDQDSVMLIKSKISANLSGITLDEVQGSLRIRNTVYSDSRGTYRMDSLILKVDSDALISKRYQLQTDFFEFDLGGRIDFNSLPSAFLDYVRQYVKIPGLEPVLTEISPQDFYLALKLKNTETLSSLFMPSLSIAENTIMSGVFTTRSSVLNLNLRSPSIGLGDLRLLNIVMRNTSNKTASDMRLSLSEIIFRDSTSIDTTVLGIESPRFAIQLQNDSLLLRMAWKDKLAQTRNKGDIRAVFIPDEIYGGTLTINHNELLINDSILVINPDNYIRFERNRTEINALNVSLGHQQIAINGYVPLNESDTLEVKFNEWDLSNFDLITSGIGFDLDGFISGDLQLANLNNRPGFFTNLHLSDLYLNKEKLGDARILTTWNNAEESVYLNAQIINVGNISTDRMLNLTGFYHPMRKSDNIRFDIGLDNFRIKALTPLLEGVLSKVEGLASGNFVLDGSLNKPILQGKLQLNRTAFRVDYLNTVYSLQHEFDVEPGMISLENLVLYDTTGNKATVSGKITHNYLRDFRFDVRIDPTEFLALNTTRKMNDLFYGSAVVSGDVVIKGLLNDISLNITATTNQGTNMFIPLNNSSYVSDNDFIIFVSEKDFGISKNGILKLPKPAQNFRINLNTYVTPDANLRIFLPYNMGDLMARGRGNIRMGVNGAGDFTLLGDYFVQSGQFNFIFENLVRKRFDLLEGGRISWTGDPMDAELDVKGLYKVKTSLSSLGIVLDSSSAIRNRINVECIIHLENQLFNPDISFKIKLPNVDEETQQKVFAVLDTNNAAMMTQQMISLLVLGSFSYAGGSSASLSNSYINVISNQLSSWLSQISKDFDVGVHYKPGDDLSSEELEVALSTQLFNDRVTIDGNFGMINANSAAQNASNIVGDVDITVKITRDGRLRAKAFNHSNINSYYYYNNFENYAPYTQGIGLSYRKEFDRFGDLFRRKIRKSFKN